MKKILMFITAAVITISGFAKEPNAKVLKAFNESFKDAKEIVWYDGNDMFEVKFVQEDIKSKITYDTEGNIISTIRYYQENQLPLMVRAQVKKRFTDMKIFGVTELTENGEVSYHIVLEGEKKWVNVKSDAFGTISVQSRLKKA